MAEEKKRNRGLKVAGWVMGILLLLIVLIPFALYIPWVQNIVKDYACEWASEKTGLDINVGRILIKFPLDVSVDDVLVLDQNRDTMLMAENLTAGVAMKPLLDGEVQVDEAELKKARYNLVTEDSSMVLRTRVDEFKVKGIDFDWKHNEVNVADGHLRGGKVDLTYLPHKVKQEADTTQSDPWHIRALKLTLDDVDYSMQMLPTIDKMEAHVGHAVLKNGVVDTGAKTVDARTFEVDSADVNYIYPPDKWAKEYAHAHPVPPDTLPKLASDSIPWTVKADTMRLTNSHARYALRDKKDGAKGLDTDCIEVSDLNLEVDDFYNRGTNVVVPVKHLSVKERSGLEVKDAHGTIKVDDLGVDLDSLRVKTMMSDIALDGHVDMAMLENKPGGNMRIKTDSKIALQEVTKAMPEYAGVLKDIPQVSPISVKGDVAGNTNHLDIKTLTADMPRYAHATVSGTVYNPMDADKIAGELDVDARFDNINFVKPTLLDKAMQKQVNFPPMAVKGKAKLRGGTISADATMKVAGGELVGRGSFNSRQQKYDVDATFNNFPVKAVLPLSKTDKLTAHIKAKGEGFDFLKPSTNVNATVDLAGVNYNNAFYRNLQADVHLNGGDLAARVTSNNANCDVDVDVNGTISGEHYVLDANGTVRNVDLQALGMYKGECAGGATFTARADLNTRTREYDADVDLKNVNWKLDGKSIVAESANATLYSCDSLTEVTFDNEDNHLTFTSPEGAETLVDKFTKASNIVLSQIDKRAVDIDTLKQALPKFDLNVKMGPDGIVQRLLETQEVDFREVSCQVRNDSNVFVDGMVRSLSVGSTSIDTLKFNATEHNKYLAFNAHMGNRPGTWDDFAQVSVEGGIRGSTIDFLVKQQNIKKEVGYRLGCNAKLTDKSVNMRFFPHEPVIGYREWTVNDSNYVNYDYTDHMLDANLRLESDSSVVALHTKRNPEEGNEDILLDIDNLRIEEWTQLVPSLDPMTGRMDANLDLKYDGKNAEGTGDIHLKDFTYNGFREGDLALKANYSIDPSTASTKVNADMLMDGARVAIASGVLNDSTSTSPLNVALTLDRFPLRKVSPFIPGNMVRLRGYANGQLQLSGKTDASMLNGYLVGDSAIVAIPKYGASLTLCDDHIPVSNNVIRFSNYKLHGHNGNAAAMNGVVDMRDISRPAIDLRIKGQNVQVINSEQKPYSEIFGKGFVDVDATVRSENNNMNVRADVTMLPTSNITYVMKDEVNPLNTTNRVDENMVTFINVNDSIGGSPILVTAAESYATTIQANIDVEQGSKINVFLNEDGKDRATIDGSGRLKYTLDFAGKDNLSGTYTIENGNVRYTPPLIAQKNFDIASGSTITWTGDMLNPQLNLTGTQHSKTSVSNEDSGSRLVDFLITANVGGTLSNIDLSFDMSSDNDMAVQNELQSMSADQRSQAAINMLLYGSYTGKNGVGAMSGFNANTALFSFLQSQLNNWAQKAIKGVDLSFGINQYQGAKSGGTETSYSYRLSKNLFNDRFKIVVGGEYSTDASTEQNFGHNLISDISVEYNLNDQGSRYLRLFRRTGYESVLEGQVTKTGVGFVMKHKVGSLNELFRKSFNKQVTAPADTVATFKDDDPFGHMLAPDTLNTQKQ